MKFSIQTDSQAMQIINHTKLHDIFISKLDEICSDKPSNRESRILAWKGLLNKHGCILVLESHMAEEFNNKSPEDYICIDSYRTNIARGSWVFVPRDFAEKALVLGYIP